MDGTKVTSAIHKGVLIDFIADRSIVHIVTIESNHPGRGEAQEALHLLKKKYRGRRFTATIPLNPVAKHILDKFRISYPRERTR